MSKRIDLPSEQDVRRVMTEHIEDAASAGGRATVIGLARRLGLSNATFWRHYPLSLPNSEPLPSQLPSPHGMTTGPNSLPPTNACNETTRR